MNLQDLPIVEVVWEDINVVAGWEDPKEKQNPSTCRSVGYLLRDTDKQIELTGDIGINGTVEVNRRIVIPKGCIKNILKVSVEAGPN